MRIASFGFRSLPPSKGSAGADKFALEFLPRLAERGHQVTGYNRIYPGQEKGADEYKGVKIVYFKTIPKSGIDSLIHSAKVTWHIITKNPADIVHIQGNNALFALILKIFRKKIVLSIDGVEWEREKWSWPMRKLVLANAYLAVYSSKYIAIDNVFTKELFEKKFKKKFEFISFGSEIKDAADTNILEKLGLEKGGYFLFVGRFIPDKGLQYLIPAFEKIKTDKKLVLVGGSPNPTEFEINLQKTTDPRIKFPGFVYGDDTVTLMKNAYAYVQPSDIEGLSPVMLSVMGLGTPLICSDIKENIFIVKEDAYTFEKSNVDSLAKMLERSLTNRDEHTKLAAQAKQRILKDYSWESITDQYLNLFQKA
ncbi:MAG: glycosyltransferase family 4 protein [Bacteroidetes bacterium]|nr:glycosyltransferase family 4 protein [Bacteroidota bacterium]